MSFFQDLISTAFGGSQYSSKEHFVSEEEIRRLVSQSKVASLSQQEEKNVEEALLHARKNGNISVQKIDHVLKNLEHQRKISSIDREGIVRVFKNYLGSK